MKNARVKILKEVWVFCSISNTTLNVLFQHRNTAAPGHSVGLAKQTASLLPLQQGCCLERTNRTGLQITLPCFYGNDHAVKRLWAESLFSSRTHPFPNASSFTGTKGCILLLAWLLGQYLSCPLETSTAFHEAENTNIRAPAY